MNMGTLSLNVNYLFLLQIDDKQIVISEEPTTFRSDTEEILFSLLINNQLKAVWVSQNQILAVTSENEEDTISIVGLSKKYKILNKKLFDKYVAEKLIIITE